MSPGYHQLDICAIPIGGYAHRWFMRDHHVSPEEALKIHQDVTCKKSVAIHWGTFNLTDEHLDEPPKALKALMPEMGVDENDFITLMHGETIILSQN